MSNTRATTSLAALSLPWIGISPVLGQTPPEIEAVFTNSKPTLDAVISPGEWDAAEPSVIEHVLRSGETTKPGPHYQFRLLWDEEALYLLFETKLTSWPGGTSGFGGNNNINFYIDPNNDAEANGAGGNMFDGYHPVIYPDTGKTSRFDTPFDPGFRTIFHEASINANFGGSPWPASSSQEEGVAIDYVSEVGANGGIIEIAFPWKVFDSEAGTDLEIFHTEAPEIDDLWYLNVCIISALGDLPTWSWTPAQVFAERPHGLVTFTANPIRSPINTSYDPAAETFSLSWESQDGLLYNLRSETDLSNGEPITWAIFEGNQDLVATPPLNTVTFQFPDEPQRFFVVETFPAPPVPIYNEDFENGQGAWTTGSDGDAGTLWELGAPGAPGPAAAHSPSNCFGTNLTAHYTAMADIWLRSPPIDLTTVAEATLNFYQFTDIEATFDGGIINILDAADDSFIIEVEGGIDGVTADWEQFSVKLPAEALGKLVKIEFRFTSDDFNTAPQAGWNIDDVELTVP